MQISIIGIGSDEGLVQVLVFNGPEGFPDKPAKTIKNLSAPIKDAVSNLSVKGLKPGRYAVAVFHDHDGDGKMRTGLFGIPKDAYGFSNNARSTFSAPSFESAAFEVGNNNVNISIDLAK
ncbi:MAG: DUF2141 domain-containing protein [Cyclobacteriaceae bacterium]